MAEQKNAWTPPCSVSHSSHMHMHALEQYNATSCKKNGARTHQLDEEERKEERNKRL